MNKQHYGWIVILIGALIVCMTACTKQYTAPAFWDVSISKQDSALTAVAYNTKSTALSYVWHTNGARSVGKTVIVGRGRSEVQLTVLDDLGNSVSEYLTVNR